jgi:DNA-binding transcriptional ArsR family regulator
MPKTEYKQLSEMSDALVARVVERLRALADPARIRLLMRLKRGPASVGELAELLAIGQPSVSKHLAVLRQAGLVDVERRGTSAIYVVRDQTLFDLCAIVCEGVTRHAREEHEALGLGKAK